jgi:thioesterase domain-containing protein
MVMTSTRMGAFDRVFALRRTGTLPPLFCLPPMMGLGWCYAALVRHLHPQQPVYCLQFPESQESATFPRTVEATAAHYVSLIDDIAGDGPYHLLGWSFGGGLAFTMACQLRDANRRVGTLAMLDSYPPSDAHAPIRFPDPQYDLTDPIVRMKLERFRHWSEHFREATFRPRRFDGDMLLFTTADTEDRCSLWNPHVSGRVEAHLIAGRHPQLTEPGPIDQIGKVLERYLSATR